MWQQCLTKAVNELSVIPSRTSLSVYLINNIFSNSHYITVSNRGTRKK
jgi:hypothetical protein